MADTVSRLIAMGVAAKQWWSAATQVQVDPS